MRKYNYEYIYVTASCNYYTGRFALRVQLVPCVCSVGPLCVFSGSLVESLPGPGSLAGPGPIGEAGPRSPASPVRSPAEHFRTTSATGKFHLDCAEFCTCCTQEHRDEHIEARFSAHGRLQAYCNMGPVPVLNTFETLARQSIISRGPTYPL